jgi:hypothetical protein
VQRAAQLDGVVEEVFGLDAQLVARQWWSGTHRVMVGTRP